jgi:hypothetical protein
MMLAQSMVYVQARMRPRVLQSARARAAAADNMAVI